MVTNLRQTPRFIYEKVYCARGDIENRIKELLDGLQIDRTSCCLFSAIYVLILGGHYCVYSRGTSTENRIDKPLVATFNQLLDGAERVYGLVKAFARCLADKRAPGKIRHTLADLIGQRVFGIACGHPDGNDADHLADDPIHKLLLGRDPVSGAPLASQPTISRFENGARRTVLYRMGRELAGVRHRASSAPPERAGAPDHDRSGPDRDQTHGAQQLTFFNGHYGGWCYLPMLGFLSFDREAEQYLCAAVLRPGKAVAADGTLGLLSRLLPLLRAAFPRARFLVRLDGGFATPEIFDFVRPGSTTSWRWRRTRCCSGMRSPPCRWLGETAHVYTDVAAGTWDHARDPKSASETASRGTTRGVVLRQTPRFSMRRSTVRGDIENRKELLDGLPTARAAEPVARLPDRRAYVLMRCDCGRRVLRVPAAR